MDENEVKKKRGRPLGSKNKSKEEKKFKEKIKKEKNVDIFPKTRKKTFRQEFIERVVGYNTDWPREQKIIEQLIRKYPEESFWSFLSVSFTLPSLAWFLTDKGSDYIDKQYKVFKFEPEKKQQYKIDVDEETKVDIIELPKQQEKIKTLKDFLKLW